MEIFRLRKKKEDWVEPKVGPGIMEQIGDSTTISYDVSEAELEEWFRTMGQSKRRFKIYTGNPNVFKEIDEAIKKKAKKRSQTGI